MPFFEIILLFAVQLFLIVAVILGCSLTANWYIFHRPEFFDEQEYLVKSRDPVLARYFKLLWDNQDPAMVDMTYTKRLYQFAAWTRQYVKNRNITNDFLMVLCRSISSPELRQQCAQKIYDRQLYSEYLVTWENAAKQLRDV